jgi:hypothetical protein
MSTPTQRIADECCALATSDHAAGAAPPRSVMNSRRLILSLLAPEEMLRGYQHAARARTAVGSVPATESRRKDLIERADFRDDYRAPLNRSDISVVEITTSEILKHRKREIATLSAKRSDHGQFFLGSDELVAGRDNKHMNFRLSIMKVHDGIRPGIIVSTLCIFHNKFGQYYLSSIIPFHRFGLCRSWRARLPRNVSSLPPN